MICTGCEEFSKEYSLKSGKNTAFFILLVLFIYSLRPISVDFRNYLILFPTLRAIYHILPLFHRCADPESFPPKLD